MTKSKGTLLLLNVAFCVYSLTSVVSKFAAKEEVLSFRWILLYGVMIMALMVYAVLWQCALARIDLIVAYSNKAIVVLWGVLWGAIIFHENLTWMKILGIVVIIAGIVVLSRGEKE